MNECLKVAATGELINNTRTSAMCLRLSTLSCVWCLGKNSNVINFKKRTWVLSSSSERTPSVIYCPPQSLFALSPRFKKQQFQLFFRIRCNSPSLRQTFRAKTEDENCNPRFSVKIFGWSARRMILMNRLFVNCYSSVIREVFEVS
jgi:hypothetical protein